MSMAEILDELPRLSVSERRVLSRKLLELETEREDLESCNAAAREGFSMLDEMEAENERHGRSS
jgi:hypothetical protein